MMIRVKYEDEQGEQHDIYTNNWNGENIRDWLVDNGYPKVHTLYSFNSED